MIQNEIIADSIGTHSPRLVTMRCVYPKFVHNEHLRHRAFSFSVSSARAIPFTKLLEEVRNDETRAAPVFWGSEKKGMSPGSELEDIDKFHPENRGYYSDRKQAKTLWRMAAINAVITAQRLADIGTHKSIVNRIIEPFIHCHVLVTGTEAGWMNYFGLRLDKAAEPTIRALAELQWKHWNESKYWNGAKSKKLEPGEWHLPFVEEEDWEYGRNRQIENVRDLCIKISVARCARLSYNSFETNKRSIIEEDLKLYDRLVGSSPIHASPAEHQATPDEYMRNPYGPFDEKAPIIPSNSHYAHYQWRNPDKNGNLGPGWIQYRKTLPNESLAPLPTEYQNG